ncbi:Band 3 anion transport protein [Fasciola gigantica]|uniref:Band 3 anion transport protein n=1 Tax=Fasciola gigantica TaxID=46835 RepID=A0A504YH94_FASGI|nr:Band 3 anion transport protein [Fasciola gigantica]
MDSKLQKTSQNVDLEEEKMVAEAQTVPGALNFGQTLRPMFIELQELVSRVSRGLDFGQDVFMDPVIAHSRVLWLETARWVNFEQNYNEIEQRFTEAHVSPMKFTRVAQLCEQMRKHGVILQTDTAVLGPALEEVAKLAMDHGSIQNQTQYDVLRAILFSQRWHPEVKGHISDLTEFESYWRGATPEEDNLRSFSKPNTEDRRDTCKTVHLPYRTQHLCRRYNQVLTECLDPGAEACSVLCGILDFLVEPIIVLLKLNSCILSSCISEVNVPVRFIFVYLGPPRPEMNYPKLARVFAVMMSNPTFRSCVYDATNVGDLLKATDLFMTESLVMPITRYTHPDALAGMVRQIEAYKRELAPDSEADRRMRSAITSKKQSQVDLGTVGSGSRKLSALNLALTDGALDDAVVQRLSLAAIEPLTYRRRIIKDFCPPFVDMLRGIRPWIKRMPSDYRDAFHKDNVGIVFSSVLFLYFVNLAPCITFAALLNTQVSSQYTVSLTLFSTGVYLMCFNLLAGQPLGFVGITGPTFILESTLASIAREAGVDHSLLRFWASMYCAIFGVIFIACNLTVMANHIRRSLEEIFNSFIAFFFLLKALFTMFKLIPGAPSSPTEEGKLRFSEQLAIAGATLFLAFIKLQFCLTLARLKRGNFFRRAIRKFLGALNVPLGMLLITALERIFFRNFNLPTVKIPPSNQIDASRWFNLPSLNKLTDYGNTSPGLVHGTAVAIGLTLAIIIFTEVALNGITAMKNKANKPNVFVIDLIIMQICFPIVSGFTGWPFVSGATVRTMSNLVALVKMDHTPAPGMPHRVTGTVEQRVSGMLVGTLVALSVFLGSILGFIPLAALYGMFLYMGVMGLRDLQFFQRFLALLKRRKHWEDWECVRGLPSQHILVFALIQALVIGILVSLNIVSEFTTASYAGIIFPLIILIYGVLRETALPKWTWLALYLHQLDRKYKLNPPPPKPAGASFSIKKDSVTSFGSGPSPKDDIETDFEGETDSTAEYDLRREGVIRQTWAT